MRGTTVLFVTLSLFAAGQQAALAASHETDDAQVRFDDAMVALEAEQVYTARRILRDLLNDYPLLHRARLELARAHYMARDFDAAEAEILRVLDDPEVPPSVQTTLLAFLAQIRDDRTVFAQRHGWGGRFYGGLTWDSNLNYGVNDIINIGGIDFLSSEEEDVGAVVDMSLLHTFNPNKTFRSGEKTGYFLWQTQGSAYYRGYSDEDDANLGVLTLRTGPAWLVPEEWRASIGLVGDQLFYSRSNLAFYTSLNPQFTRILSDVSEYTISATVQDRSYDDIGNEPRDGTWLRAAFSYDRVYRNNTVATQIGAGWADFDADENRFSYDGPEVFAGITYEAWQRGTVFGRVGYRKYDFEEADTALDPAVRDDDEWRAIAGFEHDLVSTIAKGWTLRGDVIFTNNSSNVAIYDYDRWQINLGLQKIW